MRRITSACLLQTMRFDCSNDTNPEHDFEVYCNKLDRDHTKYVIDDKRKEADGSILIKVRKQYNAYKMDGYLE